MLRQWSLSRYVCIIYSTIGEFLVLFVKSLVVMVGTTDLLLFVHSDFGVDGNYWN